MILSNKLLKISIFSSCLVMAGCQTSNPYTSEAEYTKTSTYSAIGALSGMMVGALANGANGALAGALLGGLGGLGGASVGQYQDRQEQAIRDKLENSGVSVRREGDQITLILPGRLTFAVNSSDVQSVMFSTLSGITEVVKEFDQNKVVVVGYTDNTGKLEHNKQLSLMRAGSVADYLASQGLAPSRLNIIGSGPENPVESNDTEAGRQQNRRVEIYLQPAIQSIRS